MRSRCSRFLDSLHGSVIGFLIMRTAYDLLNRLIFTKTTADQFSSLLAVQYGVLTLSLAAVSATLQLKCLNRQHSIVNHHAVFTIRELNLLPPPRKWTPILLVVFLGVKSEVLFLWSLSIADTNRVYAPRIAGVVFVLMLTMMFLEQRWLVMRRSLAVVLILIITFGVAVFETGTPSVQAGVLGIFAVFTRISYFISIHRMSSNSKFFSAPQILYQESVAGFILLFFVAVFSGDFLLFAGQINDTLGSVRADHNFSPINTLFLLGSVVVFPWLKLLVIEKNLTNHPIIHQMHETISDCVILFILSVWHSFASAQIVAGTICAILGATFVALMTGRYGRQRDEERALKQEMKQKTTDRATRDHFGTEFAALESSTHSTDAPSDAQKTAKFLPQYEHTQDTRTDNRDDSTTRGRTGHSSSRELLKINDEEYASDGAFGVEITNAKLKQGMSSVNIDVDDGGGNDMHDTKQNNEVSQVELAISSSSSEDDEEEGDDEALSDGSSNGLIISQNTRHQTSHFSKRTLAVLVLLVLSYSFFVYVFALQRFSGLGTFGETSYQATKIVRLPRYFQWEIFLVSTISFVLISALLIGLCLSDILQLSQCRYKLKCGNCFVLAMSVCALLWVTVIIGFLFHVPLGGIDYARNPFDRDTSVVVTTFTPGVPLVDFGRQALPRDQSHTQRLYERQIAFESYCKLRGYDFVEGRQVIRDKLVWTEWIQRGVFEAMPQLRRETVNDSPSLLNTFLLPHLLNLTLHYDFVLYVNEAVILTNPDFDVRQFFETPIASVVLLSDTVLRPFVNLVRASDHFILLRSTNETRRFLQEVWSTRVTRRSGQPSTSVNLDMDQLTEVAVREDVRSGRAGGRNVVEQDGGFLSLLDRKPYCSLPSSLQWRQRWDSTDFTTYLGNQQNFVQNLRLFDVFLEVGTRDKTLSLDAHLIDND